ncbi:CsgG/HfaB family protein [Pelosinus propionicus]|uniref:Curli production assembly/transport component CsgG n=1 Tax=Pelosinus propionicus DSM 13327 TaxID=1123291 RepID=A0A1I4IPI2_9FIRM|nr:CsgG/HfaB family protein [Pelosinus propionicus]SFL56268.1 Curli production assembly/transport component CsgG [Pelosinus propionicus DSM 13327]
MKKLLLLAVGICLLLLPNLSFAEAPIAPKKIGVLELENKTQFPLTGESAADAIMVHLLQAKSCDVIEREYLNQTFIQNGLQPKGVIDPAIISSVGNQLGLDYILMGNIVSAKTKTTPARWQQVKMGQMRVPQLVPGYSNSYADFEVMLVDVKTSKIVWNGNYTGSSGTADVRDALKDGGRQTVRRIYNFIPLQGSITKIDGNKIHINLGKENGIGPKDTFTLAKQNNAIDSKKPTKLKVLEVSELSCIAILKDTNRVIETGDIVIKSL